MEQGKMVGNYQGSSDSISKATSVVAIWTLLSRILGMFRDGLIAWYFGAASQTDAFFVAFKIPNLLRRMVAEGAFATAFVPVFKHQLHNSENSAKIFLQQVFSMLVGISLVFCCLGILYAQQIIAVFAPGFPEDQANMAASLLRLMMPYVILIAALSLASSALNALGYFALPAVAPVILNITMIVSMVFMRSLFSPQLQVLAAAVIIGGLLALVPQLLKLSRLKYNVSAVRLTRSSSLSQFCRLLGPGLVSASIFQLSIFIHTFLASTLEEGSVSWLYYADRLFQFPLGIFAIAIGTAILPSLSNYAASKDFRSFDQQLNSALRWITIITIPSLTGLIILSDVIMESIFGRGEFTAYDIQKSALALSAFSLGLWPLSCQVVLSRAYLAKLNSKIPAYSAIIAIILGIILAIMLMGEVKSQNQGNIVQYIVLTQNSLGLIDLGHAGIALSASFTALLGFLIQVIYLKKIGVMLDFWKNGKVLWYSCLSALLMSLILMELKQQLAGAFMRLVCLLPLGCLIYLLSAAFLMPAELKQANSFLKNLIPAKYRRQ